MKSFSIKNIAVITIFGIAMAALESAVVIDGLSVIVYDIEEFLTVRRDKPNLFELAHV